LIFLAVSPAPVIPTIKSGPFGRLSLQARLKRADLTFDASNGPIKHGFKETEASITNKLKRGTFPAT
jgi:hypothetical protein